MESDLDFEIVKKFIECLTASFPTYEQVAFIKKYKDEILANDYYRALVNEAIFEMKITEEYNREFERMKPIVIVDDDEEELQEELELEDDEMEL